MLVFPATRKSLMNFSHFLCVYVLCAVQSRTDNIYLKIYFKLNLAYLFKWKKMVENSRFI